MVRHSLDINPRIVLVIGLAALVVIVAVFALAPRRGDVAAPVTPSPTVSPTAIPTPAASPTQSASLTPSPSPSASPQVGRFVNAVLGYSIELTTPWRWSDCLSGSHGRGTDLTAHDVFVTVGELDEAASDTGFHVDHVQVMARPNPDGLTPRQWYDRGLAGQSLGDRPADVTFAGRPALRVGTESYLVRNEGRMFDVSGNPTVGANTTVEQRAALISTFRFLSADELAAARAVQTPRPEPRSAEQVVQVLAEGFAKKDAAILATVITSSCMSLGFNQGGGTAMHEQRYLQHLRDRFAAGLTVEVRPNTLTTDPNPDFRTRMVQSTWKEPGKPDTEIDLMISPEPQDSERWYWRGTITYPGGR